MNELMPQDRTPVQSSYISRPGRIYRNDITETDAQRPSQPGQSQDTNPEFYLIREDFQLERTLRFEIVTPAKGGIGFFGQAGSIAGNHMFILFGHTKDKMSASTLDKLVHGIEQIQQVICTLIEWITIEGLLDHTASFLKFSNPCKVHSKAGICNPEFRIQGYGFTVKVHSFPVLAPGNEMLSKAVIEWSIGRVDLEDFLFEQGIVRNVPLKIVVYGRQAQGMQICRINGQSFLDLFAGRFRTLFFHRQFSE